jgi:hypothetical protein
MYGSIWIGEEKEAIRLIEWRAQGVGFEIILVIGATARATTEYYNEAYEEEQDSAGRTRDAAWS